ncbi:MAG: hypothetical protein CMH31_01135 [Micavibrio sp.]|nr:hypothetical protein [Micavibrio sp.]
MTVKTQELLKDKLRAKNVLQYMLLPNIIPQIKELAGSGFGYFAFLIATVYNAVRILPTNHPYLNPDNIGKYGLRKVIAAAANNITVSRNNWDQILIFIAVLAGILLLALQFLALIFIIFNGQAFAQSGPGGFNGMFSTPNPTQDVAFQMLDYTFGIPNFFGSDVLTDAAYNPSFHAALHQLFNFYNLAILVVAVIVFLYYVIVVVAETAQTGTPFGKRFSHIYAPIRLVIAIGLLVPLAYGFNGAQYIVLSAAKMGSGFATNGWIQFNSGLTNPTGAPDAALIGYPDAPDPRSLISFMSVAVACREAYLVNENITIDAYVYNGAGYVVSNVSAFSMAQEASENGAIEIIFGELSPAGATAGTAPRAYCGSVTVPSNLDPSVGAVDDGGGGGGTISLQERYFRIVNFLWESVYLNFIGQRVAYKNSPTIISAGGDACMITDPGVDDDDGSAPTGDNCYVSVKPPSNYKDSIVSSIRSIIDADVNNYIDNARSSVTFDMSTGVLDRGWGGAGIWYSKIAEINGAYTVAVLNFPHSNKWPEVLEYVLTEKRREEANTTSCKMFEPTLPEERSIRLTGDQTYYARVMDETFQYWRCQGSALTTNLFWDAFQAIFGLNGLFDVREDVTYTDPDGASVTVSVHPLAQLTIIGKSLVESAIRNMAMAMGASFFGGMTELLGPFSQSAQAASGFFVSIATIGLSMGFILFYILPFLPFIYFFFAVGAWVKSIFEAMCAAPLWAISHLRIDGDGLPGKSAMNGYFLILEIFLRPILTVFGLVAGMAIFVALAMMLNEIFDLVVENITGTDLGSGTSSTDTFGRYIVDQFFFTIVYAVILYMMGISSFKMINLVPNNILRWLGSSATAFSDNTQDPTQGMSQYAAIGGLRIGGQLAGGASKLSESAGSLTNVLGSRN